MALGLGNVASPVPVIVVLCTISIWKLAMSGELAEAASLQGTPLPLTKQKTVRCYKENIKKDDGKNFEIEKIRKDEDVIETLQQRHSRDTNCVVVTSVLDADTLPDAKLKEYSGGSVDAGGDIDLPLSHDMGSQFGGGGGSADISLGQDFDPPRLDTGFDDLHDTSHLAIPPIPSVSTDFGSMHDPPKLHVPTRNPPFGGGLGPGAGGGGGLGVPKTGIDTGFGNLQDINTFRNGGSSDGASGGAGAGVGGAPAEEENVKTYEFATNIKRQESYDHRGFHQERSRVAAPGGGWKTTYRYDGPGGATYETSANDLDHKISAVSAGHALGLALGHALAGRALLLALLLALPRVLLQLLP